MEKFDYSLIEKGDVIGVALSGGRDSVALLYNLIDYQQKLDFSIAGINVDHLIRGEESHSDSLFCIELCKKLNIPCYFEKINCVAYANSTGLTLEEAARIKRYEYFDKILNENIVTKIALGHHKNDNVETILFNLFRGSGANGVSGMKKSRGKYIRPLLNVSRQEIDDYVKNHNLKYVEDSTNANTDYSRNYIRNVLVPTITEKFPHAIDSIARFSDNISEQEAFIEDIASEFILFCEEKCIIDVDDIKKPIFVKAVNMCMRHFGITHEVYKVNYDDLWELISKQGGKSVHLTQGIVATKEYDGIVFSRKTDIPYFQTEILEHAFEFQGVEYLLKKSEKREIAPNTLSFDFDKLPKDAIIRTRLNGDVFKRKSGSVKLKEYLIDKKIPISKRDKMLFIASGNNVLAVLCSECGVDLFIDEYSKNIFTIKIKE